jgi:hypothetical protein
LFFDGGGGNNCNPIFTDILKDCDFNTVYQLLSKNDNEASSFYNSQRERLMIRYAAVVHVLAWEHKPTDITIGDPNLPKNTHDTPTINSAQAPTIYIRFQKQITCDWELIVMILK